MTKNTKETAGKRIQKCITSKKKPSKSENFLNVGQFYQSSGKYKASSNSICWSYVAHKYMSVICNSGYSLLNAKQPQVLARMCNEEHMCTARRMGAGGATANTWMMVPTSVW